MGLLQAQGQGMTYEQRRILYRSMYSTIVSKVEIDDKSNKDGRICMLISATKLMLDQAGETYLSSYEGHQTYDKAENNYAELLAQILDNLWEIAIKARLIESIIDDEKVIMA
jgi:hypothetical protein